MKSHEIDPDQLNEQFGNVIKTALMLVENRQYADAKFVFLSTNPIIRNGFIDFIPLFHLILTTESKPWLLNTFFSYFFLLGSTSRLL